MKRILLSLAAVLVAGCMAQERVQVQKLAVLNFDVDQAGSAPKGWDVAAGSWVVTDDATGPTAPHVLAQTAAGPNAQFNVVLAPAEIMAQDVCLTVRLRDVSGKVDQGGGLVWRARDARNYYVCRWNPLENNLRLYKVVDGQRTQLATVDVSADPGWHSMIVLVKGDRIECSMDVRGARLAVKDATFSEAGRVGLWTKADAVTHFDDMTVAPPDALQP